MNLLALQQIVENNIELLEQVAQENDADDSVVIGIARYAVANGYESLSSKQKHYFESCIRPMIENVQCSGYTHELEETHRECPNILDDRHLVEYYQIGWKYCESCEAQASADAHTKNTFLRD